MESTSLRDLGLDARRMSRFFYGGAIVLTLLSAAGKGVSSPYLSNWVNVRKEANLPTWFATVTLAATALGAWVCHNLTKDDAAIRRGWLVLAGLMAFVSIDEATALHEFMGQRFRDWFATDGFLFNLGWTVPYLVFLAAATVVMIPFLLRVDRRMLRFFVLAGVVMVGGGVGVEMAEAVWYQFFPGKDGILELTIPLQELMEMLGVAVLMHGLVDHIESMLTARGASTRAADTA